MTIRRRTAPKDDFPRPWEDRPISQERWRRHRERLLAMDAPGRRPHEWWLYERGRKCPDNQAAALYRMGELSGAELAELMKCWRADYGGQ
jgi:hypothetical protein